MTSSPPFLPPVCRELKLFVAGVVLSLIAKGVALLPFGHSVDSYPKLVAMSTNPAFAHGNLEEFIAQGRFGQWALNEFLLALGIVGPGGNTFTVLLSICCFVAVGVLLCRIWRLDDGVALPLLVIGLVAIHPYHAEIFTFREATLTVALALLLATCGVALSTRRPGNWAAGCLLLFLSLSLYQVAMNYAAIALSIACLLDWRRDPAMRMFPWPLRSTDRSVLRELAPGALALVVSSFAYFAVFKLLVWQFAAPSGELARSAVIPLSQAHARVREVLRIVWRVCVVPEPLMPAATKLLIGVVVAAATAILLKKALTTTGAGRFLDLAALLTLLACSLFGIVGIMIPIGGWMAIDRTLSAVSLLVAGSFAVLWMDATIWTKRLAVAAACVLLFSFAGVNNVVLYDQIRLNDRDFGAALRMIHRLESNPGFAAVKSIAVVGHLRHYPLRYFTAKDGSDVNVSAFFQPWSRTNLLREVSGYKFPDPPPNGLALAKDYCRSAAPWPDLKSAAVIEEMAVICLSRE